MMLSLGRPFSASHIDLAVERIRPNPRRARGLPLGSFDTHVHVFDPKLSPYAATRSYTPGPATLSDLLAFSKRLTTDRSPTNLVLVQPSPYGTDNSLLLRCLDALRESGMQKCRGIAVVDPCKIERSELIALHQSGVRGLRINTEASGTPFSHEEILERIAAGINIAKDMPGWCIQVFVPASIWKVGFHLFANSPVPLIADHFGGLKGTPSHGNVLNQPGLNELLHLAQTGKVVIKLSGTYRASSAPDYSDLGPLVQLLAAHCGDSLIYGSDWPHTGSGRDRIGRANHIEEPFRKVDQESITHQFRQWVGSEQTWRKICIHNPSRLYGVDDA